MALHLTHPATAGAHVGCDVTADAVGGDADVWGRARPEDMRLGLQPGLRQTS